MRRLRSASGGLASITYLASSPVPSVSANSVNVAGMCAGFKAAGYDISIISPVSKVSWKRKTEFPRDYGLRDSLRLEQVYCPRVKGGLWLYRKVLKIKLKSVRPEFVYGRNLWGCETATRLGMLTAFEAHLPVWRRSSASRKAFEAMIARDSFQGLVVISHALAGETLNAYPRLEGKITVAHDGARSCPDPGSPRLGQGNRMRVVYAGSLYQGKGMEILAEVARKCPWADFTVIGGSSEEVARWRSAVDSDNIRFMGHVPHAKVREHVLEADVAVAPYRTNVMAEGGRNDVSKWMSPLKIFEYMAANRPIVASNLPVLREVLTDRTNALLASPIDTQSWIDALQELRDDPGLAEAISRRARRDFEDHYTWEARALCVAEFLGWGPERGQSLAQ